MSEDRLMADLKRLHIAYDLVEHPAVFTVEQSFALDAEMPGAHTKNLFLKDGTGRFWLVTVPATIRVDLKALPAVIGSKRVSFGNADEMMALLGVTPGSVTPLAVIHDSDCKVIVIFDESFCGCSRINVHPLRNTATLGLSMGDIERLLQTWQHTPHFLQIPALT